MFRHNTPQVRKQKITDAVILTAAALIMFVGSCSYITYWAGTPECTQEGCV